MTYKVTPGLALTMVRVVMYDNMGPDIYMEGQEGLKKLHINIKMNMVMK